MRVILLLLISCSLLRHGTVATKINLLSDNWILENEVEDSEDGDNEDPIKILNITIPSGIYSDLENANITESILHSMNDIKLRKYGRNMNWIYSNKFELTQEEVEHEFMILTFHGLDTITKIYLNDELLGETDNMFRRYRFDVKSFLIEGTNTIAIHFESPVKAAKRLDDLMERKIPPACPPATYKGECHINLLRKMQASFAWDWGLAAPSMGIWKNIELELYDSIHIRDITYDLYSSTEHKYSDSNDETEPIEFWRIDIKIYVESGRANASLQGILTFELVGVIDSRQTSLTVHTDSYGKSMINFSLRVQKQSVKLWWPNGYGDQQLYTFKAKWEDIRANSVNYYSKIYLTTDKSINVGFRTIELIQDPMENGLSFYFKVNGIPIFMKGSNWIPVHILPEKTANEDKVKELLQAARDAHMNMLRVWGGGVYESDYFYSLADKYGILIWQDMMFACAMYPTGSFLKSVHFELRDQIRRIQHHPSIALFATNNENEVALRQNWYDTKADYAAFAEDYRTLYVDTVTAEIRKHDNNRAILTSSPSNGAWKKDRDEFGISTDPQSAHFGDIHYYPLNTNSWIPTTFHTARFISEYGFQSYPYGWAEIAGPETDNIEELIRHRQHHPLNSTLIVYLVQANLQIEFDSLDWQDQVYLSQVSQAIALKTETEVYRCGRGEFMHTMGALYWQLNDVWVAPSWSSIEYNGNYKIVHYWMQSLFAPISLVTQVRQLNKLYIYAISDEINVEPKQMTVKMNIHKWSNVEVVYTKEWKLEMPPNAATSVTTMDLYAFMNDEGLDVYEYIIMFYLYDDSNPSNSVSTNFILPAGYQHLKSASDPNLSFEISSNKCDNGQHRISITIRVDSPAMFVYIVLEHEDIKKYEISKNGFIQVEPITAVQMRFNNPDCKAEITEDMLKIRTLNKYLI